jgi:hypothetical protein
MKPVYKNLEDSTEIQIPECPVCRQRLWQTQMIMFPLQCKCGVWKYDEMAMEFNIANVNELFEMRQKLAKRSIQT